MDGNSITQRKKINGKIIYNEKIKENRNKKINKKKLKKNKSEKNTRQIDGKRRILCDKFAARRKIRGERQKGK